MIDKRTLIIPAILVALIGCTQDKTKNSASTDIAAPSQAASNAISAETAIYRAVEGAIVPNEQKASPQDTAQVRNVMPLGPPRHPAQAEGPPISVQIASPADNKNPQQSHQLEPPANATIANEIPNKAPAAPLLAYEHKIELRLDEDKVAAAFMTHDKACRDAGENVCQILGYELRTIQDDQKARLQIRAIPSYLANFRLNLAKDAEKFGGRIHSMSAETKDLTSEITTSEGQISVLTQQIQNMREAAKKATPDEARRISYEIATIQTQLTALAANAVKANAEVKMEALEIKYASRLSSLEFRDANSITEFFEVSFKIMKTVFKLVTTLALVFIPIFLIILLPGSIYRWYKKRNLVKQAANNIPNPVPKDWTIKD